MSKPSVISLTADAVAAELNAAPVQTFEPPFTATRLYRPRFEVEDLADLRVSIVPRGVTVQAATRSAHAYDVQVDVAVQQKLPTPDTEGQVDAFIGSRLALVQQIGDYLRRRPLLLSENQQAIWTGMENRPVYAVEHLDELRVFTSVLTLTYRIHR